MIADYLPSENTTATQLAKLWCVNPYTIKVWITQGCKQGKATTFLGAVRIGNRWIISPQAARDFIQPEAKPKGNKPQANPNDHLINEANNWLVSKPINPRGRTK